MGEQQQKRGGGRIEARGKGRLAPPSFCSITLEAQ